MPFPNLNPPTGDEPPDEFDALTLQLGLDLQAFGVAGNALETNVVNREASAVLAASTAVAAATSAQTFAPKWAPGTFADGDPRWSPTSYQTYRKKGAGPGNTDPAADPANWQAITRGIATVAVAGTSHNLLAFQCARFDNVAATAGTLPATPNLDDELFIDVANGLRTNTLLRNGKKIDGIADDVMLDFPGIYRVRYVGGSIEWRLSYA